MGKTKFKQKYAAGASKTPATTNNAPPPKASAKQRPKPSRKNKTTTAAFLRNTLLPQKKMEIQLENLIQTLHEREKLTDDDFKEVKSSIIRQSTWLFLLSAIWTGLCFYLLFEQKFNPTSAAVQAAVGCVALFANLLGLLGAKFESDNLLTIYLSIMTCLVLVSLGVGGYGIISTELNVREYELAIQRGNELALSSTVTPDTLRLVSYLTGAMSIIQVPLQGYAVKNAGRMLTTIRAATNFMQTLTILMFPIGCVFIAGGIYTVETLQDSTAAITALFIFAIGCGIIMLAVLGYFGTLIHSRGMLLMFQWPVLISIVLLFGFGIWATIQADTVKLSLDDYWEEIRRFLPTTFEGRYDRVLFSAFITTYLQSMAFGCFYIGCFFLFCSFGAGLMRQEIKTESAILKAAEKSLTLSLNKEEQQREEMQSIHRLEENGLSHAQAVQQTQHKYEKNKLGHLKNFKKAHEGEIHKRWKKAWTNGSKFSQCMTKIGCASVCIVLLVVVSCGLAFLVYLSFCEDLDNTCNTQTISPGTLPQTDYIHVTSNYKRGTMIIASGANGNAFESISNDFVSITNNNADIAVGMKSCSLDAGYDKGDIKQDATTVEGTVTYDITSVADPNLYFGVDKSCQQAIVGLAVPADVVPRINVTIESGLQIVGSETFLLKELNLNGVNAAASINRLQIRYTIREDDPLHRAVHFNSDLGEIKINGKCAKLSDTKIYEHGEPSDAECDNTFLCDYTSTLYPVPSVFFESVNGFMTFSNAQLSQCDLVFNSKDSAPTMIKNVVAKCTSKHCQMNNKIDITAQRGSVELTNVVADAVAVRTQQGRVQLLAVTQLNPETGVTVTTGSGNIDLDQLVASGNIQLESKEGNIVLKIPMCGKYPAFMGSFQIAHASFQKDGYKDIFEPLSRVATLEEWNDATSELKLTTSERATKSVIVHAAANDPETNIITGTIGCHLPAVEICAYSNELLITTESGKVTIELDYCNNVCAGPNDAKPAGC